MDLTCILKIKVVRYDSDTNVQLKKKEMSNIKYLYQHKPLLDAELRNMEVIWVS